MTHIRRSVLFMPGDSMRKITKATQLDVDSIVMDLEDSVAPDNKAEARRTVSEALQTLDFGRSERLVRLNAAETGLLGDDLADTIDAQPDGYVLPKTETAAQVQYVGRLLGRAEKANGWADSSIRLLVIIETQARVASEDQPGRGYCEIR